jgi:hypothetical protein
VYVRLRRAARRWWPQLLVALAVAANLVVLRCQLDPVHYANDGSLHLSLTRWADARMASGASPMDGWFPNWHLGSPEFHIYQTFPHLVTALAGRIWDPAAAYAWLLYLLLASWPVCVYVGARMLGAEPGVAALAALLSPAIAALNQGPQAGYGYAYSAYIWRGLGTYTQLWGMWLLPLAAGFSWRSIRSGRGHVWSVLTVGLILVSHFLTGYLVLMWLGVLVLAAGGVPWGRRLLRVAVISAGALVVAAWELLPLVQSSAWVSSSELNQHSFWYDSFGLGQVVDWLVHGRIYDDGRLPVITVLVAAGLLRCALRVGRDSLARIVLGMWLVSLVLFAGRPTFASLIDVIPQSQELFLHRYIMGLHFAGILAAGIGGWWMVSAVRGTVARKAALVLLGLMVTDAWWFTGGYALADQTNVNYQRVADAAGGAGLQTLEAAMRARGPGRVYAGRNADWGNGNVIGLVPVRDVLQGDGFDVLGMSLQTRSLSFDVDLRFNPMLPAHYSLFNIRYLVMPVSASPAVPATLLAHAGTTNLFEVGDWTYGDVGQTDGTVIAADRHGVGRAAGPFLRSAGPGDHRYPVVAFAGAAPAASLLAVAGDPAGAGEVTGEHGDLAEGDWWLDVRAARRALVIFKVTYDPRWEATVDGRQQEVGMVAPSFAATAVGPGVHAVHLHYRSYSYYPLTLGLAATTLLLFAGIPLIRGRRRAGRRA